MKKVAADNLQPIPIGSALGPVKILVMKSAIAKYMFVTMLSEPAVFFIASVMNGLTAFQIYIDVASPNRSCPSTDCYTVMSESFAAEYTHILESFSILESFIGYS
jgi:hypothetical protein